MKGKVICFDLEGPLSPQDNAYEVMGLLKNGHKIFEVISRYDDILALEERDGYEPGDTLSLIIPFLIKNNISEEDILNVSRKAKIVEGTGYMISRLKQLGWTPYIISTSYQQHAYNIGKQIGVPEDRVYCTHLPLDDLKKKLEHAETSMIKELERDILEKLHPHLDDEKNIKKRLDRFYYRDINGTQLKEVMESIKVVGGLRKVDAMEKIAKDTETKLSDLIVVGDSITDYQMLGKVRTAGGIAVVFNGNRYAIPYANVGLATTDMRFLLVVIAGYMCGGTSCAIDTVEGWEKNHDSFIKDPHSIPKELIPEDVRQLLIEKTRNPGFYPPHFHYLEGSGKEKQEVVLEIHKKTRSLVRGDAAKLG